jgi:hypothetical protein
VPPPAAILDLAAGSGALSQRLLDKGYAASASDYVADNFKLSIPFRAADLNQDGIGESHTRFHVGGGDYADVTVERLDTARSVRRLRFKNGLSTRVQEMIARAREITMTALSEGTANCIMRRITNM